MNPDYTGSIILLYRHISVIIRVRYTSKVFNSIVYYNLSIGVVFCYAVSICQSMYIISVMQTITLSFLQISIHMLGGWLAGWADGWLASWVADWSVDPKQ